MRHTKLPHRWISRKLKKKTVSQAIHVGRVINKNDDERWLTLTCCGNWDFFTSPSVHCYYGHISSALCHLLWISDARPNFVFVFFSFSSSFWFLFCKYILTHFPGVCVINFWCCLLFYCIFSCTNLTLHTAHTLILNTHVRRKSWGVSFRAASASHRFGAFCTKAHLFFGR